MKRALAPEVAPTLDPETAAQLAAFYRTQAERSRPRKRANDVTPEVSDSIVKWAKHRRRR